jgi:hypothetical protein
MQHSLAHSGAVAVAHGRPIADSAWTVADENQMRDAMPGHSSLAWLLWHMARAEDFGVNVILRDAPQVLDRDGWFERLGVPYRHIGTGSTEAEVGELNARIDLDALRAYRDEVGKETRAWLQDANLDVLDTSQEVGLRLSQSGAFAEHVTPRMTTIFQGQAGIWFFSRLAVWHNFFHLGQAEHVMGLLGIDPFGRRQ